MSGANTPRSGPAGVRFSFFRVLGVTNRSLFGSFGVLDYEQF